MKPQRRTRLFLTLAWIVVGLQAATFFVIDAHLPPRSMALYHYSGTDDIIEISLLEDDNPMSRYSLWIAMAEIAPESTVYGLNPRDVAVIGRAYGFGLADQVVTTDLTTRGYDNDDFLEHVVASGPGAHKGPPWMIALDPKNGPGGDPANPDAFLTEALDGDSRGSNPGPPREFVLVAWSGAPVTDDAQEYYDFYNVLIELPLVDQAHREMLGLDRVVE